MTNAGCRHCVFRGTHQFAECTSQTYGFAGIQKAVVDQRGSRPPDSDHDLFFGVSVALGSALELLLSPSTELVFTELVLPVKTSEIWYGLTIFSKMVHIK